MNTAQENNEQIIWKGHPHSMGFLWFYGLLLYETILLIWGYRYIAEASTGIPGPGWYADLHVMIVWFGLVCFPLIILTVNKIQFRWLLPGCLYILTAIGAIKYTDIHDPLRWFLAVFIIAGFIWIEIHRKCYYYSISDTSLTIEVRGLKIWVRKVPYRSISDLVLEQGVIGRIFNVGTIIPVTHSGLGLGDDAVFGGVSIGGNPVKRLFGGFIAGGMRSRTRPRSEPQFVFYGVKGPKKVFQTACKAQKMQKITEFY